MALEAFYKGYQDYKAGNRKSIPDHYRVDFGPFGETGPIQGMWNDGGYNSASQFIGTATYYFQLDKNDVLNIRVEDSKTEYSLFYHAPFTDRHSRNEKRILGETFQKYKFSIPLNEVKKTSFRMKKIILVILSLIIVIMSGCNSPIRIEDYYILYPPDDYCDSYYLTCKLADENDPLIKDITYIKWSKEMIILQQTDSCWWVIKAHGKTLKCCNNDSLIGPLDENAINSYKLKMTDVIGEKNL